MSRLRWQMTLKALPRLTGRRLCLFAGWGEMRQLIKYVVKLIFLGHGVTLIEPLI